MRRRRAWLYGRGIPPMTFNNPPWETLLAIGRHDMDPDGRRAPAPDRQRTDNATGTGAVSSQAVEQGSGKGSEYVVEWQLSAQADEDMAGREATRTESAAVKPSSSPTSTRGHGRLGPRQQVEAYCSR